MGRSNDEALAEGQRMARVVFAKHEKLSGHKRVEIHCSEQHLAVLLAAAWKAGADSQHCPDEPEVTP